ncbi:MAG TPA: hypothetical protein VGH19_21665 [Verrucomicrobiae bacterium]
MRNTLFSALALAGLMTGCGGEPETTVSAPPPAEQPQALDISQSVAAPAPEAATPATAAPPAQAQLTESEPLGGKGRPLTQEEVMLLSYGISMFKEEKGRFPATLEEAVASRHIIRLPQLPPGEKLAYDSSNGSVKVTNTN